MPFVIGPECIDVLDRSCIDVCPVDCVYVGERKSYINLTECIDCGACEAACPVLAVVDDRTARKDPNLAPYLDDAQRFFNEPLAGRDAPLGNPGGALKLGHIGADTEMVSRTPAGE